MKVLIDGDGCPVIAETERAAALYGLEVLIFCDTSHLISSRTSRVILVDQGDGMRRTGPLFPLRRRGTW